jgi:hypothetical protein
MKHTLTANDILDDIEFEIAQGAISRNDLGEGVQTVKKHQNQMRSQVFLPARKAWDNRDVASRQFQINDMHLTLMQEMAAAIRALRRDMRQLSQWQAGRRLAPTDSDRPNSQEEPIEVKDSLYGRSMQDLEDARQPEALKVKLDVRPTRIPVVGAFLHRIRVALHHIAIFYSARLAVKQARINWLYSDWIQHLYWLNRQQQQDVESLRSQVAALQNRLAALEQGAPRSTTSTRPT